LWGNVARSARTSARPSEPPRDGIAHHPAFMEQTMPHPDHPIPLAARQLYHQVRRNKIAVDRLRSQIVELEQASVELEDAARMIDAAHSSYVATPRRPMGVSA
jgi:hypothetical protein